MADRLKKTTILERQRYVRVAAHAIAEERRVGLIDGKEAQRKLREAHEMAGWPFAKSAVSEAGAPEGGRDG